MTKPTGVPRPCLYVALFVTAGACSGGSSNPAADGSPTNEAGTSQDGGADRLPRPMPLRPPVAPAATFMDATSGSRLKVVRASGDGVAVVRGFFDAILSSDCSWAMTADGIWRCVPFGTSLISDFWYLDAGCTKPVVVLQQAGCPIAVPAVVALPKDETCLQPSTFHRVGAKVTPTEVHEKRGAHCIPRPVSTAQEVYEISGEASLVGGTIRTGPTQGGMAANYLVGEDGSEVFWQWKDIDRSVECDLLTAADGKTRCLPATTASLADGYADATCATRAGTSLPSTCGATPNARFIRSTDEEACGRPTRVYQAGGKLSRGYEKFGDMCEETPPEDFDFYALGPEVTPEGMKESALGILSGSARLKARASTTPGGTVMLTSFWDDTLSARCTGSMASDGVSRCLPTPVTSTQAWGDSTCTKQPLALLSDKDCDARFVAVVNNQVCPNRRHIFPIEDAPFAGPIYRSSGTRCTLVTNLNSTLTAYALGLEIPATQFIEITRVVGP